MQRLLWRLALPLYLAIMMLRTLASFNPQCRGGRGPQLEAPGKPLHQRAESPDAGGLVERMPGYHLLLFGFPDVSMGCSCHAEMTLACLGNLGKSLGEARAFDAVKVAGEGGGQGEGRAARLGQLLGSLHCRTGTTCGNHLSEALLAPLHAPLRKAVQVPELLPWLNCRHRAASNWITSLFTNISFSPGYPTPCLPLLDPGSVVLAAWSVFMPDLCPGTETERVTRVMGSWQLPHGEQGRNCTCNWAICRV